MINSTNIEPTDQLSPDSSIINNSAINGNSKSAIALTERESKRAKQREKEQRRRDREISRRIVSQAAKLEADGWVIHPSTYELADETDDEDEEFNDVPEWSRYKRIHNADEIVAGLYILPESCSLTPVQDKLTYRKNWTVEPSVSRAYIEKLILEGEESFSTKTGSKYRNYYSGYGLRTGNHSDGILAIDVDGSSAQPVLEALSCGDLPETISWKSGKPGRYQLAFQIPDEHREVVEKFTKTVVKEAGDFICDEKEQLEFRYNGCHSCLPPSRHPETGSYQWVNSPEDVEIAIAPQWLLELLPKLVAKELKDKEGKSVKQNQKNTTYSYSISPALCNIGDIPIYEILANNTKLLINNGVGEGGRNDTCLKLSITLLTILEGCQRRNINTAEKSPNDLLNFVIEYAKNCSPSMDEHEAIGVFERATKFAVTEVFQDDFYYKKVKNYLWNNDKDEYRRLYGKSKNKDKSPEQVAQDNAKFEAEKIIHQQLKRLDFEKIAQMGITITRINKEKLSPQDLNLEKGKISIILSAKGTGKTEGLKPYMPRYKAVYSWHTRVTLAIKMAYDLGLIYKSEIDDYRITTKASFCANSAYKFHPKFLQDNALLLFDECDQIFDYTFDSLCNKDGIRPLILANHKAHLLAALTDGSAAYMSADISQKEIDYISAIAPSNAKIELVVNEYKPKKGKLKFSTDGKPDSVITKLLADLDNGIPCFLLDDFKNGFRGCKTIAEFIRKERPDLAPYIVEINGDTSEQQDIKDYVEQINEKSLNTMLLSCSPSIISGISLTNGRFNKGVYGVINGILTPNNGSQGFARVRGAENINVWVANAGINYEASKAITPSEVNKYWRENYDARNKHLQTYEPDYNVMTREWESPHWQLFCQNSSLKNLEMRRLRYWYKQKLIDDGYELIETEFGVDASGVGDSLKEIAGQLKLQEIRQISDAKNLSFHEVQQLSDKSNSGENLTLEERQQLTKHHLKDTFGDELIAEAKTKTHTGEELFGLDAIAFLNHRNTLENSMRRFYRNFYQETADIASNDIYIENRQMNLRPDIPECNQRFPKDIKWQLRERKLWEFLEFQNYLDPNKNYYPEDYQPLINKVRKYMEPIKQATGYNFEKISDGQVVGELYGMLGLKLSEEKPTVKGKRIKVKKITRGSWDFACKFVAHQISKNEAKQICPPPPILLVNGNFQGGGGQMLESITSNEHSHLETEIAPNHPTSSIRGVDSEKSEQLILDFGSWDEYYLLHQNDHENDHDIYSYQDDD